MGSVIEELRGLDEELKEDEEHVRNKTRNRAIMLEREHYEGKAKGILESRRKLEKLISRVDPEEPAQEEVEEGDGRD